jgi:hypothetical protein
LLIRRGRLLKGGRRMSLLLLDVFTVGIEASFEGDNAG